MARTRLRSTLILLLLAASACGGGATTGAADVATESERRALRQPRPEPLDFAPRVAVGAMQLVGTIDWPRAGVTPELGVSELVVTGLLARRDVEFVERRRFDVAYVFLTDLFGRKPNPAGDRVTVMPVLPCGACDHCRAGRASACPHSTMIGSDARISIPRCVKDATILPNTIAPGRSGLARSIS